MDGAGDYQRLQENAYSTEIEKPPLEKFEEKSTGKLYLKVTTTTVNGVTQEHLEATKTVTFFDKFKMKLGMGDFAMHKVANYIAQNADALFNLQTERPTHLINVLTKYEGKWFILPSTRKAVKAALEVLNARYTLPSDIESVGQEYTPPPSPPSSPLTVHQRMTTMATRPLSFTSEAAQESTISDPSSEPTTESFIETTDTYEPMTDEAFEDMTDTDSATGREFDAFLDEDTGKITEPLSFSSSTVAASQAGSRKSVVLPGRTSTIVSEVINHKETIGAVDLFKSPPGLKEPVATCEFLLEDRRLGDGEVAIGREHLYFIDVHEPAIVFQKNQIAYYEDLIQKNNNLKEELQPKIDEAQKAIKRLENFKNFMLTRIAKYEAEIKTSKPGSKKHKQALIKLERAKNNLHRFGSNYVRDILNAEENKTLNFSQIMDTYKVDAPINLNHREMIVNDGDGEQVYSLTQVGVVARLASGHTDLHQLEFYQKNPDKRREEITRLSDLIPKLKKEGSKNKRIVEGLEYYLHELIHLDTSIEVRKTDLLTQLTLILNETVKTKSKEIQELAELSNAGKITSEDMVLDFIHHGLLNEKTNTQDKSGWMHNELHEREDHYAAMRLLQGKKLIFDDKGPFIDKEGNIHLPGKPGFPPELTINTVFLNTTVQGHTANDGRQAEINKEEFPKLYKVNERYKKITNELLRIHPEKHEELKKALRDLEKSNNLLIKVEEELKKGKSDYEVAEDLQQAIILMRRAINTVGCLSAKDRTGIIGFRAFQPIMAEAAAIRMAKNNTSLTHPQRQEFIRSKTEDIQIKTGPTLLSSKSVTHKNIAVNTIGILETPFIKFSSAAIRYVPAWMRANYLRKQVAPKVGFYKEIE